MSDPSTEDSPSAATLLDTAPRTSLVRDSSFWGMTLTQFLGAFNDNLFKQLVLLLAVGGAVSVGGNRAGNTDYQSLAMMVFSLPFILFSGIAGLLSEQNSKRTVIVLCKVAEIGIVLLGLVSFLLWNVIGIWGLLVVLFLMGTHSAFFAPGKFGILPELFAERDLPKANGAVLMTTFLAIIFGTALAGLVRDTLNIYFPHDAGLWIASFVCLAIALAGTQTALLVRKTPAADPTARFRLSSMTIPKEVISMLKGDHLLAQSLLVTCVFWMIGGLVQPTVNAVGKRQFQVSDTLTSLLAAAMGIGIAGGCMIAGFLSKNQVNFRVMRVGAWMTLNSLLCLAVLGQASDEPWAYAATLVLLVLLGASAGIFVVPLQVFLQARPPDSMKGRTIATMNLMNWIAIIISAILYFLLDKLVKYFELRQTICLGCAGLLMLPVLFFFHPDVTPATAHGSTPKRRDG